MKTLGTAALGAVLLTAIASPSQADNIVVWRTTKVVKGHDTGHVFVVARPPVHDAGSNTWTVHVYDSSSIAHHDDSRKRDGKFRPGLGSAKL